MRKARIADSVEMIQTPRQRFDAYLQQQGMRKTEQRRILLDRIFTYHQHFDADQLFAQLPARGEPGHVSRPTVYRTLTELVDAGLLRKLEVGGRAVYEPEHGYPQHDHLYCQECHQLFEFQNEEVVAACDRAAQTQGFHVVGRRILIYGVCAQCSRPR